MPQPLLDTSALIGVAILVVLNALFVAAEFALVTVRWTRIEELVENNVFGALVVKRLIEDMNGSIAAVQLGITFTSLGLGWLGEPAFAHLVEPLFRMVPGPFDTVLEHAVAVALSFLAITYLHTVLGEQVPKALALQRSEQLALLLGGPLLVFARVFRPFIAFINHSSDFFVRLMHLPPARLEEEVHTVEELDMLVEESEEAGLITADEATYVRNVFELSDKTARDAMVPRERVVTVSIAASEEEVLETARETAHTRMPVWEGTPDNIVGIVNTKDLFHLFSLRGLVILMDAMYPALFVGPDQPVAQLLTLFKRERRPMAVVRDDAGVFLGIVTLEDILEEIVGEIEDEHDAPRRLSGDSMPRARTATPVPAAPVAPVAPPAPAPVPPQTVTRPLPPPQS
jgi:putative hemolysin